MRYLVEHYRLDRGSFRVYAAAVIEAPDPKTALAAACGWDGVPARPLPLELARHLSGQNYLWRTRTEAGNRGEFTEVRALGAIPPAGMLREGHPPARIPQQSSPPAR